MTEFTAEAKPSAYQNITMDLSSRLSTWYEV